MLESCGTGIGIKRISYAIASELRAQFLFGFVFHPTTLLCLFLFEASFFLFLSLFFLIQVRSHHRLDFDLSPAFGFCFMFHDEFIAVMEFCAWIRWISSSFVSYLTCAGNS